MTRYRNKTYWRIPGGEVQFGHLSRSIVVWCRGRKFTVKPGHIDGTSGGTDGR